MSLPLVQQVGDGRAARTQRIDNERGLIRRHDWILGPLQDQQGYFEASQVLQWRAAVVDRLGLRQWSDQRIQIATFELMGVAREGRDVRDAVVIGPGPKHIAGTQRQQHGIAAGAAAANGGAPWIDPTRAT